MRERARPRRIACTAAALLSLVTCAAVAQGLPRGTSDAQPGDNGSAEPQLRPFHLNFTRFEIPFSVDQNGEPPVEIQLYVSRDAGAQWELFAAQPTSGKPFLFEASGDGRYWFATRTVDKQGNSAPLKPQLAVNVDTAEPQVDLQAAVTPLGAIAVSIDCVDAAPSPEAIRLEYSIDQTRQWIAITEIVTRSDAARKDRLQATAEIRPIEAWHQVSIRALVGDLAGNKTIVTRQVDKPRIAAGEMRLATTKVASPAPSPSAVTTPAPSAAPMVPPVQQPAAQNVSPATPGVTAPPAAGRGPERRGAAITHPERRVAINTQWAIPQFAVSSGIAPPAAAPSDAPPALTGPELTAPLVSPLPTDATQLPPVASEPPSLPRPKSPAEAMRPIGPRDTAPQRAAVPTASSSPATAPPLHPVATPQSLAPGQSSAARVAPELSGAAIGAVTQMPAAQPFTAAQPYTAAPGSGVAPPSVLATSPSNIDFAVPAGVPVRYSRSRQFSLEYEIESAGLAGVSEVELWGTVDGGQTWKRWGADPDRQSPFDIETSNDGIYGFRIVVVASNGLATPRPLNGEPADILIVIDTQVPKVRITGAAYGEADQTGSLLISYQCEDANLLRRPVSLSFSESMTGPWSTIAAGLENDGMYVWPADPNLPRQIYLRIDATDMAGNVASYVLDVPIDIQGLAPRARIRGFNPLTGSPGGTQARGEAPAQTATQPKARFK